MHPWWPAAAFCVLTFFAFLVYKFLITKNAKFCYNKIVGRTKQNFQEEEKMIWRHGKATYNTETAKAIKTEEEFRFLRHSDGSLFSRRIVWHLMQKRNGIYFAWGETFLKRSGEWVRSCTEFCHEYDPRVLSMVAGLSA